MDGSVEKRASFGRFLRACRRSQGLTQTELAKTVGVSTSVVSRAERGARLPDRLTVDGLDEALDAGMEIVARWLSAVGSSAVSGEPSARWVHNYPAQYHGLIWMRWAAAKEDQAPHIGVDVKWGRWRIRRRVKWPDSRTVSVWHTKGDDGFSIPVIVRSERPMHVDFFLGEPPTDAIDINPGWIDEKD